MTGKQIFGNLKHHLPITRGNKYLKWLKDKYPHLEPHHLLGSQGKIKLTDYLVVMVTREEHQIAEKYKIAFFTSNLHRSLIHLIQYIQHLEEK